ncbi:hypothetical protein RHGRI_014447 [Rhododendron griersonianum]|uniref:Uncharacterized protein n=1 Tax=Rhododendron griersonianum TaxID=479676 RepID=A0AAV6K9R7_9ERIC|nr:hypothetical protein RHGRI_014447 [Rhododendron griersonianum]
MSSETSKFFEVDLLHFFPIVARDVCLCTFDFILDKLMIFLPSFDRQPGEESDADSSRETSSDGGSECGAERGTNHAQGAWSQRNNMRAIAQSFNRLSADKGEISNPPGFLLFEYFDSAPPFSREPLTDMASRFLFLRKFACFSLNALLPS